MIEEVAGQNNGTGYADSQIEEATGTSGVHSAFKGYNPEDGTYVGSTQKPKTAYHFELKPTDTGNKLLDKANAFANDVNTYSMMDDNLKQTLATIDPEYGGHGINKGYRDDMDSYTMWELGDSEYDTNANASSEESVKLQRNEEQSSFIVAANGLPRLAVRGLTTTASAFTGIIKGIADVAGGNEFIDKYISPEAMSDYAENFNEFWEQIAPVYRTKEQEDASSMSLTKWLSAANWADLLDNVGFTVGAGLSMYLTAGLGQYFTIGAATLQATGAAVKAATSEDAKERTAWQNMLPAALTIAATAGAKGLPKAWRNRVATFATSLVSSSGEAEIEAINARKDFIKEKTDAIDSNVESRKQETIDRYNVMIEDAKAVNNEAKVAQLQQELEKQLIVLDWQKIKGSNKVYKDADKVANITRLANYAILSGSNMIQFGKLLSGGWKTYNTMGRLKATKAADQFAKQFYEAELAKAGTDAVRRAEIKAAKNQIYQKGLLAYHHKGGVVFDPNKKLSLGEKLWIGTKLPLTEGSEEMGQSMASNAAKAYGERNTDDYYGQISGLDQFLKTESAWQSAVKAAIQTLGNKDAWSEFTAGAIMGAIGCPWARSARFTRSTGEVNEDGSIKTEKHWRSPIIFQGGIYHELKKASSDRKRMGEMAEQLNSNLSEKNIRDFQKHLAYITHHMQYEDDKDKASNTKGGVFMGNKFSWQNAEDADLVKMVELFQNTGQIDLLRAIVNTNLDFQTAEELRSLQNATNEKAEDGSIIGPYAEFDLTDIGENATDAQKQNLNEQVDKMKAKIKEQTERYQHAIDTYESARRELAVESNQGLSDDQLNCLTWYKVRLAQFDKRTREMFEKHFDHLSSLNDSFHDYIDECKDKVKHDVSTIQKALDAAKSDEAKAKLEKQLETAKSIEQELDMAESEWQDRWARAAKVSDNMAKARILFSGNKKADPIGDNPAKKPWYLPNKQWAKRVTESMEPAARRRMALMGTISASMANGAETQEKGILDLIIRDLYNPTNSADASKVLLDKFGDDAERREFAEALNDMRNCQAAVVRFKDLYQFYKDNPYAMTHRQAAEAAKTIKEAQDRDVEDTKEILAKADSVAKMYNLVLDQVEHGTDIEIIEDAIRALTRERNKIALQLVTNQTYVSTIAKALDGIIGQEGADKTFNLAKSILLQAAINASKSKAGIDQMHSYIESLIHSLVKSPAALIEFIDKYALAKEDADLGLSESNSNLEEVLSNLMGVKIDLSSTEWDSLQGLNDPSTAQKTLNEIFKKSAADKVRLQSKVEKAMGDKYTENVYQAVSAAVKAHVDSVLNPKPTDAFKAVATYLPMLINAVDNRIKDHEKKIKNYKFGKKAAKSDSEVLNELSKALGTEVDEDTFDSIEDVANMFSVKTQNKSTQSSPQPSSQSTQTPEQPLDNDTILDGEQSAEQMRTSNGMTARGDAASESSSKNASGKVIIRPSLPFFSLKYRKEGKTIRMNRMDSNEEVVDETDSPYKGFWDTLEQLGAFDATDKVSSRSSDYINEGDEVFFVVDRMDKSTGRSKQFGLSESQIAFKGKPIIWMCVKKPDGRFQVIGALHTADNKIKPYAALDKAIRDGYSKADDTQPYVHPVTAKVDGLHSGLVETQDRENNLIDACDTETPRLAVQSNSGLKTKGGQVITTKPMVPGTINLMVRDEATGEDMPMRCRIAHYNSTDETRLSHTDTWQKAEAAIEQLVKAARTTDPTDAAKAVTEAYNALSQILALQGYGIHINLVIDNKGNRLLQITKTVYENGVPVEETDLNGKTIYRTDSEGKPIVDKNNNPIPLYKRTAPEVIKIEDDNLTTFDNLKKKLQDKAFNAPFRVSIQNLESVETDTLIEEGFITTNIVHGGAIHTVGSFVEVDVTEALQKSKTPGKPAPTATSSSSKQSTKKAQVTLNGTTFKITLKDNNVDTIKLNKKSIDPDSLLYKFIKSWYLAKQEDRLTIGDFYIVKDSSEKHSYIVDSREIHDIDYTPQSAQGEAKEKAQTLTIRMIAQESLLKKLEINFKKNKKYTHDYSSALEELVTSDAFWQDHKEELRELYQKDATYKALIESALSEQLVKYPANLTFLQTNPTQDQNLTLGKDFYHYDATSKIIYKNGTKFKANVEAENVKSVFDIFKAGNQGNQTNDDSLIDPNQQKDDSTNGDDQGADVSNDDSQEEDKENGSDSGVDRYSDDNDDNPEPSNNKRPRGCLSLVTTKSESAPRMDYAKEIQTIRRLVPGLTRDEAIMIVDSIEQVAGKGVRAQGLFRDGLIVLARTAARGTLFHEAFHAIFSTMLTEQEKAAIIAEAKKYSHVNTDAEAEEVLADNFADYMIDRTYAKTWGQRIRRFFKNLLNFFRIGASDQIKLTRKIFDKVSRGEYAKTPSPFSFESLQSERQTQYRMMGYSEEDIKFLENAKTAYANQPAEVRDMLSESGFTEDTFDMLSQESRDDVIRCM